MSTASAKVIDLESKRDELQAKHESNEELREQIVALKKRLKKAKTDADRSKLQAEIDALDAQRSRSTELAAVMDALVGARAEARQEALAEFLAAVADKSDEELEALHLRLMSERAAIKPKITALAQLRSSRAKIAANREVLKHLTPAEILAALSPEQRAALAKK